jgi:hypothetical protein
MNLKMRLSSGWIGGIWKRPKEVCKLCRSRGRAWKVVKTYDPLHSIHIR